MEYKRVKNVDALIASKEQKDAFLTILAEFGLYQDVSSLIYSFICGFTGYDVIYSNVCNHLIRLHALSGSIFYQINYTIRQCNFYLIRNDNVFIITSKNKDYFNATIFMYNNEIYAIYDHILYKVIIDYEQMKFDLQHVFNYDRKLTYYIFNYMTCILGDNLIVDSYACNMSDVVNGLTEMKEIYFKHILRKDSLIEEYILNNLNKVIKVYCYELSPKKKKNKGRKHRWIYQFIKDNTYYEYYNNECLLCGSTDVSPCKCNFIYNGRLNNNVSIISSNEKLYFRPSNQENIIKFDEPNEIYQFNVIGSNIAFYMEHAISGNSIKVIRLK